MVAREVGVKKIVKWCMIAYNSVHRILSQGMAGTQAAGFGAQHQVFGEGRKGGSSRLHRRRHRLPPSLSSPSSSSSSTSSSLGRFGSGRRRRSRLAGIF